ncbi:tegument protein UL37 [Wood mouse herpesvirus]|uniref:Tegument protein UL37 n=1 Tax=Wood mouse herpesvirus TaxID=432370 RepID=D0U1Q2_9GAMA|nr:tegument protein UL37 [Wood mouse herpesvirus]ACY41133.1 tegument protein UL37 [Wood mouse herpesvirus]
MTTLVNLATDIKYGSTLLGRIKTVLDASVAQLTVADMTADDVGNFLNSLKGVDHELFSFIRTYPVFFIMHLTTLEKTQTYTSGQVIKTIKQLINTFHEALCEDMFPDTESVLSNSNILKDCSWYLTKLETEQMSTTIPNLPKSCITFPCMEQLHHLVHNATLATLPTSWTSPLPSLNSVYVQWFVLSYKHSVFPKEVPEANLQDLADKVTNIYKHLFVAHTPQLTGASIILARSLDILSQFTPLEKIPSNGPALAFGDDELSSIPANCHLMFGHLIESIYVGMTYTCTLGAIEQFIREAFDVVVCVASEVKRVAGSSDQSTVTKLVSIKRTLIEYGLSENRCEEYAQSLPKWDHREGIYPFEETLDQFHQKLSTLVKFCLDFYNMLMLVSPTSISHSYLRENDYLLQLDRKSSHRTGQGLDEINLLEKVFTFVYPKIPEQDLQRIHDAIESDIMRTLLFSWVNRNWGIVLGTQIPMVESSCDQQVSEERVAAYCKRMPVGDLSYEPAMVSHKMFYKYFIRHIIAPTIHGIFSRKTSRNRALFQIRWLLSFAITDTPQLQEIRRPLGMLYFELLDIINGANKPSALKNLLDHTLDIRKKINKINHAFSIPQDLILYLFVLDAGASYVNSVDYITDITPKVEQLLGRGRNILRLGTILCHTKYNYHPLSHNFTIMSSSGQSLDIHVETLKSLLGQVEKDHGQLLEEITALEEELRGEYNTVLSHLQDLETYKQHELGVAFDTEPWTQLKQSFSGLLSRISSGLSLLSKGCSSFLRKRFHDIFTQEIITPALLKAAAAGDVDIIKTLQEIPVTLITPPTDTQTTQSGGNPTDEELAMLYSTYSHIFSQNAAIDVKDPPQLKKYSSTYDRIPLDINWQIFTQQTYTAEHIECPYTIVKIHDIIKLLS